GKVAVELVFKSSTCRPAEVGGTRIRDSGTGRADGVHFGMTPAGARSAVGEQVRQHEIAQSGTCRGQFVELGHYRASDGASGRCDSGGLGLFDIGAVEIDFDT